MKKLLYFLPFLFLTAACSRPETPPPTTPVQPPTVEIDPKFQENPSTVK